MDTDSKPVGIDLRAMQAAQRLVRQHGTRVRGSEIYLSIVEMSRLVPHETAAAVADRLCTIAVTHGRSYAETERTFHLAVEDLRGPA